MHRDRTKPQRLSASGGKIYSSTERQCTFKVLECLCCTVLQIRNTAEGLCFFFFFIHFNYMAFYETNPTQKTCKTPNFTNKPHSPPNYAEPLVPVQLFSTD